MADVPCQSCGHVNPPGSNFCSSCGAAIGAQRAEETEGHPFDPQEARLHEELDGPLPEDSAMFVVMQGAKSGSRYLLDQDHITIGRHPNSDIFLDDITVSRRHAEVRHGESGWAVADVGSLNGTYVNRERIDEVPLREGDEVQIGKFKLIFWAPQA